MFYDNKYFNLYKRVIEIVESKSEKSIEISKNISNTS